MKKANVDVAESSPPYIFVRQPGVFSERNGTPRRGAGDRTRPESENARQRRRLLRLCRQRPDRMNKIVAFESGRSRLRLVRKCARNCAKRAHPYAILPARRLSIHLALTPTYRERSLPFLSVRGVRACRADDGAAFHGSV